MRVVEYYFYYLGLGRWDVSLFRNVNLSEREDEKKEKRKGQGVQGGYLLPYK